MKVALKKLLTKRAIIIVLAALLVLSAFNTYLIFEGTRSTLSTSAINADFVLSQTGSGYKLKNALTGNVADQPASASTAINAALAQGKSVYLNPGTYVLTDDVYVSNKVNARIFSDGATINGNGRKIVVYGDNYTTSQRSELSGFTLLNGTIRVENSFATTITDIIFENTTVGIEFANTNTWTEYNKIEDCQFINATEGIVFRTPTANGTGSYASTEINRCSFNLKDSSIGINVEPLAEFSDSQLQNVRFWLGEDGKTNQTALVDDGSMCQSVLLGVVFESFALTPVNMFGLDLGSTCKAAPILDNGVSFLGNWTAKVHNPFGIWMTGVGSVFKQENINVPVGVNDQYSTTASLEMHPLQISNFSPQITVMGNFNSDAITVRIRTQYIDNSISPPITKTFTNSSTVWLTENEIMRLFPSQSIIWAIIIDAKSTQSSTDATVKISGYGATG